MVKIDGLAATIDLNRPGTEFVAPLLAAIDDAALQPAFAAAFTAEGQFSVGNVAPVIGPGRIRMDLAGVFQVVDAMHHELIDAWRQGDVVIAEVRVHYRLKDGCRVAAPALIRIRLKDGRVDDMFVAMDRSTSHPFRDQPEAREYEMTCSNGGQG